MNTPPETARRLRHMLRSIDGALATIADADFDTYRASYPMRMTAERSIEIISEASKHIPADVKAEHPEVPWAKIRAIGNVFRHEYSDVDDHVVWLTVKVSLPQLRPVIVRLLERYET